jgi:hypothetical protein
VSAMGEMERCLGEKAGLLKGILSETKKIGEMLALQDMDGLNGAVAARQACIVKIDELDRSIKAIGSITQPAGSAQGRLFKEIRSLLGEILEADSANMKVAGDITITLMNGIKEVNTEKNMMRYQPAMASGSRFVDREG